MRSEPAEERDLRRTESAQRGALLGTFVAIAYAVARFRDGEGFARAIDRMPRLFFDFLHYYYASADALRNGLNPVPGYLYSPVLAVFLMPWTLLGPDLATVIWALLQALALSLLVFRCVALGSPGAVGGFLAALLVLLSTATLHSLKWGQVGLIVGVAIMEGVMALARRRDGSAALWVGFAIGLKFYPAILWPLAPALRRWRASLGMIVTAAVLAWVPSLLVMGERRTERFYLRIARSFSDASPAALANPNSQAVVAWLRREFSVGGAGEVALLGALMVLATLVFARLGAEAPESSFQGPEPERTVLAGLLLAALVPFFVVTCWPLYFCTLPGLTLLTVDRWRRRGPSVGRGLALGILFFSGLLQTFPAVDLVGGWDAYVERGVLLLANLAVVVCALVSLAPLTRPWTSRPSARHS